MKVQILLISVLCFIYSCKRDKGAPLYGGFPKEVGAIISNHCAVSGCHNSISAEACEGLDLSSWEAMFKGSRNNSAVIPYHSDQSFLFQSINTFHHLGPMMEPVMPLNKPPLGHDQVTAIKDWINNGAPDNRGFIKFSDDVNRKKIYVANQGCDLITVFDANSKLIMRSFEAGNTLTTEAPHDLLVSPDGQYLYISFYTSNLFQKFRTSDNVKVSEMVLYDYSWHSITISGDSKTAVVTHLSTNGKIKIIDLRTMTEIETFVLSNPHGCSLNYDGTTAYITSQQGNFLYKINLADPQNYDISQIPLQTGETPFADGIYKPYAIAYFPDYSKYAVTCQGTNEVRIFTAANDSLIKTLHTSGVPQLMSFSKKFPYFFVSCMEDTANAQTASQVNIFNYNSLQMVSSVFTGYQPRGLTVDDDNNCVWIANRNISPTGWVPHHSTSCNGKNGYITLIDMRTLKLIPNWKTEVSVDPYCISIRK